jgi:hypothetical protein
MALMRAVSFGCNCLQRRTPHANVGLQAEHTEARGHIRTPAYKPTNIRRVEQAQATIPSSIDESDVRFAPLADIAYIGGGSPLLFP